MAKDNVTPALETQDYEPRIAALEAQVSALEEMLANQPPLQDGASAIKATAKKLTLSGETFEVEGQKYRATYPKWKDGDRTLVEEDLLSDSSLQAQLVKAGSGLVTKIGLVFALVFACLAPATAITVTITPTGAEIVKPTSREFFALQDLMVVYRASTRAFELQVSETRNKLFGGKMDSVTIAGHTTDSLKLIFLRTVMLEANTTLGYRVFLGRNSVMFDYNSANTRLTIRNSKNRQPLWFGHADSLKVAGISGATNKLAYVRLLNRWTTKDYLPTTSVATIAAGAAAGSSPTISISGDAYAGTITLTTGGSATTGTLATIDLKIRAATGTRVVVTPTGDNSILHASRVKWVGSTTGIVGSVPTTALSNSTASYTWDYTVVPY